MWACADLRPVQASKLGAAVEDLTLARHNPAKPGLTTTACQLLLERCHGGGWTSPWVVSMRQWIVVVAVCAGMAGVAAAQDARTTLVVTRPATIGLDQPTADAFADLVRGEIARRPNFAVVVTSLTPPEVCGDAGCAAMVAQQTQA